MNTTTKPASRAGLLYRAEHNYLLVLSALRLIGDPSTKESMNHILFVLSELRHAAEMARAGAVPKADLLERVWANLIEPNGGRAD